MENDEADDSVESRDWRRDAVKRALGALNASDVEAAMRALTETSTDSSDEDADATSDASKGLRTEVLARVLQELTEGDAEVPSRSNRDSGAEADPGPEKLISETAIEEGDELEEVKEPQTEDPPSPLTNLLEELREQGYDAELTRAPSGRGSEFHVTFDLPAGRSTRTVSVAESDATLLAGGAILPWRSLQRYDGVWSANDGVIEVLIRGDRLGPPARYLLSRLAGRSLRETDPPSSELSDDASGVNVLIGEASDLATALLISRARPVRRRPLTLRVSGIAVATTDQADDLVEEIADSLSLSIDMRVGMTFTLQRLQDRRFAGRGLERRGGPLPFPRNRYPHAPVLLYLAGRDFGTAPLIRYWSFYQVLEYFFPQYSSAKALRLLSRHLRSPTFDPHREEDVLQAVVLASKAGGSAGSELEQLTTTLRAVITADEVVRFLEESGSLDRVQDRKSELTTKTVRPEPRAEVLPALAQRIYDVRCRIVHSKGASARDEGPGLLPGTHHEDLVRQELPLLQYLAQQALVNAAEPLTIPPRASG